MKKSIYTPATIGEARSLALIFIIAFFCVLMSGCGSGSDVSTMLGSGFAGTQPTEPGSGDNGGGGGGGDNNGGSGGGGASGACSNALRGLSAQEVQYIEEVCVLTNNERQQQGLATLTLDVQLSEAAQAHARDMHARGYFSHDNPEGKSPFDRMRDLGIKFGYAAENIAQGYKTPKDVMQGWMKSAGHKANILHTRMKRLGVGYYQGYWVQAFAD